MSKEAYDLSMLMATWLSAIGTIGAVVVALGLARRERPRVRVTAGVKLLIDRGQSGAEAPAFCVISAVNTGSAPANVVSLGWSCGWPFRGGFVQLPSAYPWSGKIPSFLEPGRGLDLLFPIEEFAERTLSVRNRLNGTRGAWLAWRRLRCEIYLSTGQTYRARPSKELASVMRTGDAKRWDRTARPGASQSRR